MSGIWRKYEETIKSKKDLYEILDKRITKIEQRQNVIIRGLRDFSIETYEKTKYPFRKYLDEL